MSFYLAGAVVNWRFDLFIACCCLIRRLLMLVFFSVDDRRQGDPGVANLYRLWFIGVNLAVPVGALISHASAWY